MLGLSLLLVLALLAPLAACTSATTAEHLVESDGTELLQRAGIVNGEAVPAGALPFLVALRLRAGSPGSEGQSEQFCGGALIGPRHVLTAGHCGFVWAPSMAVSVMGLAPQSKSNYSCWDAYPEMNVSAWTPHPNFTENMGITLNDVAVVTLSDSVEGVQFAQIPQEDIKVGSSVFVAGWGLNGSEHSKFSVGPRCARYVEMEVDSYEQCSDKMLPTKTNLTNEPQPGMNVCTKSPAKGTEASACVGDSGGPLFAPQHGGDVADPKTVFSQIGVVSWGSTTCDGEQFDDVFTRTFHMREWICSACDGCCKADAVEAR
jgi:secreted trypsin-like serine protease